MVLVNDRRCVQLAVASLLHGLYYDGLNVSCWVVDDEEECSVCK